GLCSGDRMADDTYYDGIPEAPDPAEAPSPRAAPSPGLAPSPARFAYLVGRLRGRQITIEEATELFELQQRLILAASPPPPRPTGLPPPPPPRPVGTPSAGNAAGLLGEDALWEAMPFVAAAAGVFAAVLKRAERGLLSPGSVAPASSGGPRRPGGTDR
ncbi:MAG: hypothetical protein ACRECR_04210, partial [Thermoplasmata archaeon]